MLDREYVGTEWRGGRLYHVFSDGYMLPVIAGGSDQGGDGGDGGDGSDDDSGDDGDDDSDDDDDDGSSSEDDDTKDDPRLRAEREKADRFARKFRKEKKDREAMEARLKELEDKDKDDATKLQEQLETVTGERDTLGERVRTLEIENELLSREDMLGIPARRRRMIVSAILPDLDVEDDGENNLDDLLAGLKKDDPGLFVGSTDDDDDGDGSNGDGKKRKTPPPSGGSAKKRKDKNSAPDRAALGERFPALKRR